MSGHLNLSRDEIRAKVQELRGHFGIFSFQNDVPTVEPFIRQSSMPELGIRPGATTEWLVEKEGGGALTSAFQIMSQSSAARGTWAIIDPARECYVPALSGWGIDPSRILVIRPATVAETCWAIEQCLRCPGVTATWAWIDKRIAARVHRRWQLAAEVGGGVGLIFRPITAEREPVWADLRLLVTPQAGSDGDTRRVIIKELYRRGGLGGGTQAWEIDHAAGVVRLVPEVANPASMERKARA
jgi:protein ImuA